jgi:non-heme chloroperoxidase
LPDTVLVNGVQLSVESGGSGPPLVFLHGWSMSGRFFQRQPAYFRSRNFTMVPDMRGHGNSEKVLHGHTVPTYAHDVHGLLQQAAAWRPILVGWSMGAMVAYEYLQQFGMDSVAGIVIVDQPPSDFAYDGYEYGIFTTSSLATTSEALQVDQASAVAEFAELMLHEEDEQALAWMTAEIQRVPPAIASAILLDQTMRDYRALLPEIRVPTLVIFGEDPKLTNPDAGRYTAQQIPGARLELFPRSSHCPFWEEADAFNAIVAEFASDLAAVT